MKRMVTIMLSVMAFLALGIVNVTTAQAGMDRDSSKQLIKCSTCGAEFTSSAGVTDHAATNAKNGANGKALVKCSTCGTEFTSPAGVSDHVRLNPGHDIGSKTLVKCSTCGVEFTSLGEYNKHVEVHPEHK